MNDRADRGSPTGLAVLSVAWAVFVLLFMIAVWSHLAALRRRLAPDALPMHWEMTGAAFGIGIPLAQPMYAMFRRENINVPIAVFPFSMEGREAALARLRELETGGTVTPPSAG